MIIRIDKTKDYTIIANFALNDSRLSLKAKGLWSFIMTKPDHWKVNYRGLQAQLKEGKGAILSAMKELEDYGYLVRGVVRNDDGTFSQGDATLYEKPCTENQSTDKSSTKVKTDKVKTDKESVPSDTPYLVELHPLMEKLIQIVNPREKVEVKARLRLLRDRLKEYTEEEIVAAAHAFSKSEWHKQNKQMSVDNLLAPSKFGRWYAGSQEPERRRFV